MRPLIFMVLIFSIACIVPSCNVTSGPLRLSFSQTLSVTKQMSL